VSILLVRLLIFLKTIARMLKFGLSLERLNTKPDTLIKQAKPLRKLLKSS